MTNKTKAQTQSKNKSKLLKKTKNMLKKTKAGLNQTKKPKESQLKKVKNPSSKIVKKLTNKASSQKNLLLGKKPQKKSSVSLAATKATAKIKTKNQIPSKTLSKAKYSPAKQSSAKQSQVKSSIDLQNMQKNSKKAESMLKMLANSKRLMILCHIFKGKKTAGDLTKLVSLSHSALSQHLAKMRALNLVEAEKIGQEVFYRIESKEIEAILSTLYLIYCK